MKRILFTILSATLIMSACSKKDDAKKEESNTVEIGGSTYSTVKIGTQTWTAVNYNGSGGVNYNNSNTNDANYGKLYTLAEAKSVSLPSGWRLPSKDDAEKLFLSIGATKNGAGEIQATASVTKKLRSTTGWTNTPGDNSSGFNAYPTGDFWTAFSGKGELATFWTTTAVSGANNFQYVFGIWNTRETPTEVNDDIGIDNTPYASTTRVAIRFVKDNQ